MSTLTERKRHKRPAHYARKDARTRIYRQLYGIQGEVKGLRTNHPETDETRRLNTFWTFQNALHVYEANVDIAEFTVNERAVLERRLDSLRRYKPKTKEQGEIAQVINIIVSTLG